jgi:hypothetical protein
VRHGDGEAARRALPRLRERDLEETPWLRPWRWLLEAQLLDVEGDRDDAVALYTRALRHADGHPTLRGRAEEGLRAPFRVDRASSAPGWAALPGVRDLP